MNADDFARVRDAFVNAAKRAVRIGFDAIEIHLAHGYLLHSFVSPLGNQRTDGYGGALERRMSFPLEVATAMRAAVPPGTPLGARITASDWLDGGLTVDDAVVLAKALKLVGLDYIDVSSGNITPPSLPPREAGYNVPLAEKIKKEAGIATRVVGMIVSPKQAEAIVAEGKADQVAMARAFLDNPHWGWQAAAALGADVPRPPQYQRVAPKVWPGMALLRD